MVRKIKSSYIFNINCRFELKVNNEAKNEKKNLCRESESSFNYG